MSQQSSQTSNQSNYPTPPKSLRYQCPLCKELTELKFFETTAKGINIFCDECKEGFFYPSGHLPEGQSFKEASPQDSTKAPEEAEESLVTEPTEAPQEPLESKGQSCPKCANECALEATSCPQCGLLFSNVGETFTPEEEKESNPHKELAISMWKDVLQNWEKAEDHEKYISLCLSSDLIDFAANSYRVIKQEGGEKAEKAEKQIAKIILLTQEKYLQNKEAKESQEEKVKKVNFILMLVLLAFGLTAFYIIWKALGK